ncbi:MAG: diacylglycerol kinase family lipid kinase, partial [Hymenobacter sp.]|nr:diacylglycerol kinase family lipid kinase [Hymenobacter sp.]
NAYIAPRADLRDGLLDVCLIDALPLGRALRVSLAMALGNLPQTRAADYFQVPRGSVVARAPIAFHVDGDYLGDATDFAVELLPLALAVAV